MLVLDDAQSFSLPLAAVVYFCVEEPLPEKAPGPAAQGVMQNRSSAGATLVEESTTDAAVAGVEALVLDGATPISKAPFRGRRPLVSGQAMLGLLVGRLCAEAPDDLAPVYSAAVGEGTKVDRIPPLGGQRAGAGVAHAGGRADARGCKKLGV